MKVIEAERLQKVYPNGNRALHDVSVSIERGEMIGVLGTSGAGKTTFLRLLNGALRPTAGQLTVLGQRLDLQASPAQLRKLRGEVGAIYQNHNIIPSLSVLQNVLMGRLGREAVWQSLINYVYMPESKRREAIKALALVGLTEKLYDRAEDLSGGQQQRVAVARVFVQQPRLLLADEPIASVDGRTAATLLDVFARLNTEQNVTVVMNLHQVDMALRYCRRILVFEAGRIKYDGTPDGLAELELYAEGLRTKD